MIHTGILNCIVAAKNNDSHWADQAIAEISLISGNNYQFQRNTEPNKITYTIMRVHNGDSHRNQDIKPDGMPIPRPRYNGPDRGSMGGGINSCSKGDA